MYIDKDECLCGFSYDAQACWTLKILCRRWCKDTASRRYVFDDDIEGRMNVESLREMRKIIFAVIITDSLTFLTQVTLVWFLARVPTHVNDQVR